MRLDLSPERLLLAYANGIFPMADGRGAVEWFAPDPRAILELECFLVSRSLRAAVRNGRFRITMNEAFPEVIKACATRPGGTWISLAIRRAYIRLHQLGFAHSVEAWSEGGLVGGLYGVSLRGAFFGESMFHRATDASKVALVHLVEHMRARGMVLLDVQFMTDHLRRFGAMDIPRKEYERRLGDALQRPCSFLDDAGDLDLEFAAQREPRP